MKAAQNRIRGPFALHLSLVLAGLCVATDFGPGNSLALDLSGASSGQASPILPSSLHSLGNRIVNASNQTVRVKGLMIPDPARLAQNGRYDPGLFRALQATGANTIRIPVHPQFWKNNPDYMRRYLDTAVQWAGDLGLYVILDWHSIGNVLTGYAPEAPELFCHTKAMTLDFWDRAAARYKEAPHVIFEIFNEPQNISAKDWRDFANEAVGVIRRRGAKQLIIVGGLEYGRDLAWVLEEPVARGNIAYASHIFPSHAQSRWDHDFGDVARRYPVLMTEWGFIAETGPVEPSHRYLRGTAASYGDPLMAYLAERGMGWVACWYDDQWQPAMLLQGGKGYTGWGEFVRLELKRPR